MSVVRTEWGIRTDVPGYDIDYQPAPSHELALSWFAFQRKYRSVALVSRTITTGDWVAVQR